MKNRLLSFVCCLIIFVFPTPGSATLITPYVEGGETLTEALSIVSISTGGSGGEDRLTDILDTVFISTGGTGGEDRLTDIFNTFSISTGGSGGEDRATELFNNVINIDNSTSLSDFLTSIPISDNNSIVNITAFDLFDSLYLSIEVSNQLAGYTNYRIESSVLVTEPETFLLLLPALLFIIAVSLKKRV